MALSALGQTNLNISTPSDVFLAFPPDTACFSAARADKNSINKAECPQQVTQEMVAFLNLTSSTDNSNYIQAYCLNPPSDDSCPFGYCSQPDIAGILVRVATYVTNFCLTILVFYGAEDIEDTFYTTLLQLYSILVTAVLTVTKNGLTKLHAVTALLMVASPVTVYILVYSLRNVLGSRTRLDDLIGHGKIMQKALIMAGMTLWFGLVVFTFLPSSLKHFSQPTCESPLSFQEINLFVFSPVGFIVQAFAVAAAAAQIPGGVPGLGLVLAPGIVFILVITVTLLAFVYGAIKHRNTWNTSQTSLVRKMILAWRTVKEEYPFVHFMLIIFLPTVYWVAAVEIGLIGSNDQSFQLSFGQVLATFVAVPPVISCLKLLPQLIHWLTNLYWVRAMTGRPKRPWKKMGEGEGEQAAPVQISFPVKQASIWYGPGTFEDVRDTYEKPDVSMA